MTTTIVGAGQVFNFTGAIAAGDTLDARYSTASAAAALVTVAGAASNAGSIVLEGGDGGYHNVFDSFGATLQVAGVLTNTGLIDAGGGTGGYQAFPFGISGGYGAQVNIATGGTLNNTGRIDLHDGQSGFSYFAPTSTGATLTDAGVLSNTGSIEISGETYTRYMSGTPAQLAVSGLLTNAGTVMVDGAAGYYGASGRAGTLTVAGSLSNSGHLTLENSDYTYGGSVGGVLLDRGVLTNTGTILVQGSTLGGTFPYGSSFANSAGATLDVSGVLTNQRQIELQGGTSRYDFDHHVAGAGQLTVAGTLTNNGTILVDAGTGGAPGGMLSVTGTLFDPGTITGGGTLVNQGVLISGTGTRGVIKSGVTLLNDGLIKVSPNAAFTVADAVGASAGDRGVFDITVHSTLTLSRFVAGSQTVAFIGGSSTLALGGASSFHGVISGLAPTDTIDLQGLTAISASVSGTTLTVGLNGGASLHLALAAPLPASDRFTLASDGRGGTDLVVSGSGMSPAAGWEPALGAAMGVAHGDAGALATHGLSI